MREVLEAIMAALEAQKAEIAAVKAEIDALKAQLEATGVDIGDIVDVMYSQHDKAEFDAFSGRHGSKFEPITKDLKVLVGEDFDPLRETYEKARALSETEGYDEDAYVNGVLAEVVQKLNSIKGALPDEAAPAVEAAEEMVQEAAAAQDEAEAIEEEGAAPDGEWSEEALEKEKSVGRRLYA